MPSVLGALSKAISDTIGGGIVGVQGGEEIRRRQALEAQGAARLGLEQHRFGLDQQRLGLEQQLQPYRMSELQERLKTAPIQRRFLEAEAAKMGQPQTQAIGDTLLEREPGGGWRTVFQRPENPQETHLKLLTDQLRRHAVSDAELATRVKALAANPALPAPLRAVFEAAASDPQAARHVLGQYSGNLIKPNEPRNFVELLMRANDPNTPPEERARLLKVAEDYKKAQVGGAGADILGDDAIEIMANQYLQTGILPSMGMGRAGTEARAKVVNRAAALAKDKGIAFDEQGSRAALFRAGQSELTQLQAQRGKVMAFARTAEHNMDVAGEFSRKVDRSGMPVVNRWLLAGRNAVAGDPDVAAFHAAVLTAATEYARVMGGGTVTTDTARKEAESIISSVHTPQQFKAVMDVMRRDMANRERGYDEQIKIIKDSIRLGGPQGGAATSPPAPSTGGARIRVIGPNGERGTVPEGTDLGKYPGWRKAS